MKNILLIEPKAPDFNIYSMYKLPRMGLVLIGTMAKRAGYNVKIIFQEAVSVTTDHILWADLVGIHARNNLRKWGRNNRGRMKHLESTGRKIFTGRYQGHPTAAVVPLK